jgi:hypothetical protein
MIGERFGRLVVVAEAPKMYRKLAWQCRCDCGAMRNVPGTALRQGNTKSCGCLHRDTSTALCIGRTKHGHSSRASGWTPEYTTWSGLNGRCNDPKNESYPRYGGRGIKLCERWRDFRNFFADMGPRPPGTSLDRIDNDGNYEPGNCRWASPAKQRQNQRRTILCDEEVMQIRWLYNEGHVRPRYLIAAQFGISVAYMRAVGNGRKWK